ncbi:MAG: Acylphosphatase [Candidatus Methanocomedens sp.]|nr:MAG: Acylphosphatase [ANME-2 cluster archaeon]
MVVVSTIAVKRYNICRLVKTTTVIRNLYVSSPIKEISMKKVTLHISGNVQRVGYRAKVISIANALSIKGFIQNLPDGRVKIIAQGEQSELDKLIQAINISNSLINVTNVEQEYSIPSDDYEGFNKVVGDGETDERLDNAVDLFKKLITVTEDGFSNLGDKVDQSKIEITSEIHSLRVDFNTLFDTRISKIEYELTEIKDKVMVLESSTSYNLTDKRKT